MIVAMEKGCSNASMNLYQTLMWKRSSDVNLRLVLLYNSDDYNDFNEIFPMKTYLFLHFTNENKESDFHK